MGKLKAGMKLADFLAQATGRQINKLGSKLGMDKDILEDMSENQIRGAILDESQQYMRNKRKNVNRRVGAAAAGGAATYGVVDFIHDMLGISSVADGTLSAEERKPRDNTKTKKKPKAKSDSKSVDAPPRKPKRKSETDSKTVKAPPRKPKRKSKSDSKSNSGVTFTFDTVKRRTGKQDLRKGGMVISSVDNRKKR